MECGFLVRFKNHKLFIKKLYFGKAFFMKKKRFKSGNLETNNYFCSRYHESHKEIATCNNEQGAKTISQILWKKCCFTFPFF